MRFRYLLAGILVGILLSATTLGKAHRLSGNPRSLEGKLRLAKAQVRHDRRELALSHGWTDLNSLDLLRRDVRYVRVLAGLLRPPHYFQWLCIHYNPRTGTGEGAWNANTGNGYYGGLQMDMAFQRRYGADLLRRKGTADHWTPLEQMRVAETAWATRGFYPWPLTARACGLI